MKKPRCPSKVKRTDKLNMSICHEGIRILVCNQKEENGQLKLLETHYWNLFWDIYAERCKQQISFIENTE